MPKTKPKANKNLRTFVSPAHKNQDYLIVAGKVVTAPPNAFSGGMGIDLRRDGDVWAKFSGGVLQTDDLEVIAWCEAHDGSVLEDGTVEPDICRDVNDPQTRAWVALVEQTLNTGDKEATLPPGTDVGAILRGEATPVGGSELMDRAIAAQGR
jgi:hypothetical protein